jgi:hypothetical protein
MRLVHGWVYKKPTHGTAALWIGPFHFRVTTGAAGGFQIEFKLWVNVRRTLIVRKDRLWSFKVMAYKDFPRMK